MGNRAAVVASLILAPFLSQLSRQEYAWWRPEALAGIVWLAAVSVGIAALLEGAVFEVALALLIGVQGAAPASRMLASWVDGGLWLGFGVAAAAGGAVLAGMREKAYPVIGAIGLGTLVAAILPARNPGNALSAGNPMRKGGVLYLILDEHAGLAGLPEEIPECRRAAESVAGMLSRNGFTVYSHAYSNYPITLDSVSSVLNRRLLGRTRELVAQAGTGARVYELRENRLVADAEAAGERSWICGHKSIQLYRERGEDLLYEDRLGELQNVEGGWARKAQWLIGGMQASDPVAGRLNAFFPFRAAMRGPGPLSLRGIWPEKVGANAGRGGLSLVHLLTPHGPYVYRADGRIRPMEEWAGDRTDRRLPDAAYTERYARYCEQVEHLSGELASLFNGLRGAGVWDDLWVVIHGDHGSRIRRARGGDREEEAPPERFDYLGEPDLRDLLDRFSTLAAIKQRGQREARMDSRRDSVLRILERDFYGGSPERLGAGAERVYLFDEAGRPVSIDIKTYWR